MKPITLSQDQVRAALDGRLSQVRMPIGPQPVHRLIEGLAHVTVGMNPAEDGAIWYDSDCISPGSEVRCPFGIVGDRLTCDGITLELTGVRVEKDGEKWVWVLDVKRVGQGETK